MHTTSLLGLTIALVILGSGSLAIADTGDISGFNKITMQTQVSSDTSTIGYGAGDLFGYKITNMGDLDGNGVEDFATIAFEADGIGHNELNPSTQAQLGTVYLVLMNIDSTVLDSHELSNCAADNNELRETRTFGENLDYLGVIDGKHTLLIADYWFSKIHVLNIDATDFSHTCSSPITVSGLDDLAWPFTIVGDVAVDGDLNSVPDLIVGASVWDGIDQEIRYRDDMGIDMYLLDLTVDSTTFDITATSQIINDNFLGNTWDDRLSENVVVATIDSNDATTNFVLGEPRDFDANPHFNGINGFVHVTTMQNSISTFTSVNTMEFKNLETAITAGQDGIPHFGIGLANMGDLDGNGADDIAVGIEFLDIGNVNSGAVAIMFLDSQGNAEKISLLANDGVPYVLDANVFFGKGLEILDIDGVGLPELVASAHADNTGGANAGAVYVLTFDQNNLNGLSYDMTPTPVVLNPTFDNYFSEFSSFVNYAYADDPTPAFGLVPLPFTSTITQVDNATSIQSIDFTPSEESDEPTYCEGLTIDQLIASGNYNIIDNRNGILQENKINGTNSNDLMLASDSGDFMVGKKGDDCMIGGAGNDILKGKKGNDEIYGNGGDDTLRGNNGSDKLFGGIGNDKLFAGKNDDFLYGNDGDDLLDGKKGNDTCDGGSGTNVLKKCEL